MENPFKYTTAAVMLIVDDIKKIAVLTKYISLFFTLLYFAIVLALRQGNFIANIILASLFLIYTIFDLITFHQGKKHKEKRKKARLAYKIITLLIKGALLGANMYGLYVASTNTSFFAFVSTAFALIVWIINISLEIAIFIIDRRLTLLKESISKDTETILQPVTNVRNFFRKLKGEEQIAPKERSKLFLKFKKKIDDKRKNLEVEKDKSVDAKMIEQTSAEEKKKEKKKFHLFKKKK